MTSLNEAIRVMSAVVPDPDLSSVERACDYCVALSDRGEALTGRGVVRAINMAKSCVIRSGCQKVRRGKDERAMVK